MRKTLVYIGIVLIGISALAQEFQNFQSDAVSRPLKKEETKLIFDIRRISDDTELSFYEKYQRIAPKVIKLMKTKAREKPEGNPGV